MRHAGVHGVVQVLVEHLPVRALHHTEDAAGHFHFAHRRAVAQVVDRRAHAAQEFRQALAVARLAGEDEAAIAFHARQAAHGEAGVGGIVGGAFQPLLERHAEMAAIELEGPGVVRAAEELADAAVAVGHHLGALVRAAVVQDVHAAVAGAHHQHVLVAQARGVIVARLGHLAFVADVDPGAAVDALHLQFEDRRVGVQGAVHAVAAHHLAQLLIAIRHGGLLLVLAVFPARHQGVGRQGLVQQLLRGLAAGHRQALGSSTPICTSTLAWSQ